jgi:tRNA/rRNA methyltransferase
MANFGLSDLALVSPFESDWKEAERIWRQEASVSAIDAMDIIDGAKIYASIPEAAAGCGLVLGTSSLHRMRPERDVLLLKDAPARAAAVPGPTAIVFGPEKTGLTKEDLSHCAAIINIPTLPRQPSMNLGQSVAVVAYELARAAAAAPAVDRDDFRPAPAQEIEWTVQAIAEKLREAGGENWAHPQQLRAIRRGLIDARLTKTAVHALKLLLKKG